MSSKKPNSGGVDCDGRGGNCGGGLGEGIRRRLGFGELTAQGPGVIRGARLFPRARRSAPGRRWVGLSVVLVLFAKKSGNVISTAFGP